MSEDILKKLRTAVAAGKLPETLDAVKQALKEGLPVKRVLLEGLIPGVKTVGELFDEGELFLPELITTGKVMHSALDYIKPMLSEVENTASSSVGRFLIGTVKGDIHDIGKNIVVMMLKSNRWEVTDLGIDIYPEDFCAALKDGDFHIVGMSSLLTMTMASAAETIDAIKNDGLRENVKIMVGGAPVTQEDADQMGADGYAETAWGAVTTAERLLKELRKQRGTT